MRSFRILLPYLLVLLTFACSKQEPASEIAHAFKAPAGAREASIADKEVATDESSNQPEDVKSTTSVDKKKIIKDGNLSIRTIALASSKQKIDQLVKKYNAYYGNEEFQNTEYESSYRLVIRIASADFEQLVAAIENGGDEITVKNIYSRDVTEEYIDLESRLTTKKQYVLRYKELLKKTSSIKDILAIEENIRVLQEEIESVAGRLKYLTDQVAYSTLNVELIQQKEYVFKPQPQGNFWERLKTSLTDGWLTLVNIVLGIISLWPFLLCLLLVIIIAKAWMKRKKS